MKMAPCEKARNVWQELHANKLGVHFRRQQVTPALAHLRTGASVAGFIVDFYCHKAALVIEVDGGIHNKQKKEDAEREQVLIELGLRIVRFRNEEVMKDLAGVLTKIHNFAVI